MSIQTTNEFRPLADRMRPYVIEDFIGQDYFARNIALLKPQGRLIQVAVMSGHKVTLDLAENVVIDVLLPCLE